MMRCVAGQGGRTDGKSTLSCRIRWSEPIRYHVPGAKITGDWGCHIQVR